MPSIGSPRSCAAARSGPGTRAAAAVSAASVAVAAGAWASMRPTTPSRNSSRAQHQLLLGVEAGQLGGRERCAGQHRLDRSRGLPRQGDRAVGSTIRMPAVVRTAAGSAAAPQPQCGRAVERRPPRRAGQRRRSARAGCHERSCADARRGGRRRRRRRQAASRSAATVAARCAASTSGSPRSTPIGSDARSARVVLRRRRAGARPGGSG